MFKDLKINERLKKGFTMVALIASIAGAVGAVMMVVIMMQYKSALTNYGFSQGDIGKAMIVFADARSATRGIIGYNDDALTEQLIATHDEKKAKFEDYWRTVEETIVSKDERELYDKATNLVNQYWEEEAKAIEIGKSTDDEENLKAQQMMTDTISPLYEEVYETIADLLNINVDEGKSGIERIS